MTNSKNVPSSYTARWDAGIRQPAREASLAVSATSSPSSDQTQRKYCSSCNTCRKLRVKCSGGHPCQRCTTSPDPSLCVYNLSQRRGKRKAHGALLGSVREQGLTQQSLSTLFSTPDAWVEPQDSLEVTSKESSGPVCSFPLPLSYTRTTTEFRHSRWM